VHATTPAAVSITGFPGEQDACYVHATTSAAVSITGFPGEQDAVIIRRSNDESYPHMGVVPTTHKLLMLRMQKYLATKACVSADSFFVEVLAKGMTPKLLQKMRPGRSSPQ